MALYKIATKGNQISTASGYSFAWPSDRTFPQVTDVIAPNPADVQKFIDSGILVTASGGDQTSWNTQYNAEVAAGAIAYKPVLTPQQAVADSAAITSLAAPAGGTGAAAGAYDTAGNRDLAIASINAIRTDLAAVRTTVNALLVELRDAKVIS